MSVGGYEYEFVETCPDIVVCQICKYPSKEPYITKCCGNIFCKSCLDKQKEAKSINYACPVCREENEFEVFPNKQIDRQVRSLRIYCTNKKNGCEWQGELNYIDDHRKGCQFEEVNCTSECGMKIQRKYLANHVEINCSHRKVKCQRCHDTGEHQFIEGQHQSECPKLPLPCPYNCGADNILREKLREHTDRCSLEEIQCKYHNVGCDAMIARKDQKQHNREMMNEHHLLLVEANQRDTQNRQEVAQQFNQQRIYQQQILGAQGVVLIGLFVVTVCLYVQVNK